ncbi:MAG: right-handed parallel beta-helix repeat-containing protein, partial [Planctomycetota bacterium]
MKKRGTFFSGHTAAAVIVIITFGFLSKAMSQVREVPFPYPTIQRAIDAAGDGDTVLVHRGTYRGAGNCDLDFYNKKITVKSEDPSNPVKVAATIIDCQGGPNNSHRGFIFQSGENAESVLTGFTIINGYIRDDGQDGSLSAIDGTDGLESRGGAILCINGSSPTIRNCIITNCLAEGGWGGNGADGGEIEPNGGNGGNAGAAYGGAIYCSAGCNPIIRSCTISNCTVLPGTPGNGGSGWDGDSGPPAGDGGDGGDADDAYGGAVYFEGGSTVLISSCVISDCNAVQNPVAGSAGPGGSNGGESGSAGEAASFACGGGVYYGEENLVAMNDTTVTGNSAGSEAGGIYYDVNNIIVMADCNITGNSAESGSAGGILIHHGATATLDNCDIRGNIANSYGLEYTIGYGGGGGVWFSTGTLSLNGCNIEQNIARGPVAVGGGIYAGDFGRPLEATVDINDCTISGNTADYGGATCALESFLTVRDSNVFDNTANYGAGLYFVFSDANIAGSSFTNNSATDLSGMELYCSGGGLYGSNSSLLITHCVFTKNGAEGSGGGLFLIGPILPGGSQEITNCLIAGNSAILDGGGISSNMGAMPKLTNCTLADNDTNDILSSGGGLSCYDSDVNIINSILWHNTGAYGPQIAIGDPMETENPPARVFVEYSSVHEGEADVFVGQSTDPASGPMLKWLTGNIVDDPHLVPTSDIDTSANYYLSHIPAGQLVDSPCINAGLGTAAALAAAVGNALTTRTDHEDDSGTVDMGYHHQVAPDSIRQYPLTISVDGNEGGVLYAEWGGAGAGSIAAPNTVQLNAGTVAELTAVADTNNGYTVGDWNGTDDDAAPGPSKTVTMYRSRVVRVGMPSNVLLVPSQYSTIEEAVNKARTDDVIVVSPRFSQDGHIIPYTVSNQAGIDPGGKRITITSEDPLD